MLLVMRRALIFHIEGHVGHVEPYYVDADDCWKCSKCSKLHTHVALNSRHLSGQRKT